MAAQQGNDFMYAQDGGGSSVGAYIFETSGRKPLDVHLDIVNNVQKFQAGQKAKKAAEKKAMEKALGEFDVDSEGAWQYDIPLIDESINSLQTDYTNSLMENVNPETDPKYQAKKRQIESLVNTSEQQKESFKEAYEALYQDRDATNSVYDWDNSMTNLMKYQKATPQERLEMDELLVIKKDNLQELAENAFSKLKEDISSRTFVGKTMQGTVKETSVGKDRTYEAFRGLLESNPEAKELAIEGIANLPPTQQKELARRMSVNETNGVFATEEEEYMKMMFGYMAYNKKEINSRNNPNAGRNQDRDNLKRGVNDFVNKMSLMMTGDKRVFTKNPKTGDYVYTGDYLNNQKLGNIAIPLPQAIQMKALSSNDLLDLGITEDDIRNAADQGNEIALDNRILQIKYSEDGGVTIKTTQSTIDNRLNGGAEFVPIENTSIMMDVLQNSEMFKKNTAEAATIAVDYMTENNAYENGVFIPEAINQQQTNTPLEAGEQVYNTLISNATKRSDVNKIKIEVANGGIEFTEEQAIKLAEKYGVEKKVFRPKSSGGSDIWDDF